MRKHRVNLVSAVNSRNVSKADGKYLIRDVVHALDGIVLNGRMYPGEELAKSVKGLNGKPAPAGHPKDSKGRHISATNGEALAAAWVGAYCTNSRYEGGRAMCDVVINEAQAKALPAGQEVISRLDAAIDGTNAEPIAVSSGLFLREVAANGESRGKKYRAIAADMEFDHLAILLNEKPAGTPEEGVGMFVNSEGNEEPVEVVNISDDPADLRSKDTGFLAWIGKLLGLNQDEMSFDEIQSGIRKALPQNSWPVEVYSRSVVWVDEGNKLWQQDYAISSEGTVSLLGNPQEVERKVEYKPIGNTSEVDAVKEQILAALNAAGISVEGLSDAQVLTAYNAMVSKPVAEKLAAANSELETLRAEKKAEAEKESRALAEKLAANSALTVDELMGLGVERLRALTANSAAAPVLPAKAAEKKDGEFTGYSLNAHLEGK